MSNLWYKQHKKEIFPRYTTDELLYDINNYINGKGRLNKLINHYFKKDMYKAVRNKGNNKFITPFEAINNDDVINFILSYCKLKNNFYNPKQSEVAHVEQFLRNTMGICYIGGKVSNFNPVVARDIYNRYNIKNRRLNILDTSSGFGSRMLAAVLSGHNYCGFEPNKRLNKHLHDCVNFLYNNNVIGIEQQCKIFCCGSEIYKSGLKSKFDIMFTSPHILI